MTGELSRRRSLVRVGLVVAALWSVATLPAFTRFRQVGSRVDAIQGWVTAGEILATRPALADMPWGSVEPLMSLHHRGRVYLGVQRGSLDFALPPAPHHPPPRFSPAAPGPLADFYTGVPLAITPEAIRAAEEADRPPTQDVARELGGHPDASPRSRDTLRGHAGTR